MQRLDEQGKRRRRWVAAIPTALLVALALALPAAATAVTPEYKLTIGVVGHGEVKCRVGVGPLGACAAKYPEGTEVELVPVPEPSWEFEEWGGDCEGQPEECLLTIEEDESATATFVFEPPEYPLEVDTFSGTGYGEVECKVGGGELETCGEYPEGTKVILEIAYVEEGSKFVEWQGDCTGTGGCSVTMNGPRSVIAVFDLKEYLLTVEINGKGSGTVECEAEEGPEACKAKYPWETEVTILPVPAPGSSFSMCKVDGVEQPLGKCQVEMTKAHNVIVSFGLTSTSKFKLKVKKSGTGSGTVTSSPAGIDCTPPCEAEFTEGTAVTLTAVASSGSEFVSWSGCASQPEPGKCKVTMSAAKEVTVTFNLKPKFKLTVKKSGTGTGTVTSSPAGISCGSTCSAEYESGKEVTLTQVPDSGSEFVSWSGACTGSGACKVTMSAAKEVTATFNQPVTPPLKSEFTLEVKKGGTGTGTVTSSPAGIDCGSTCAGRYEEGTAVTLTPTPDGGSQFKRWFGGGCDFQATCTTTMNGSKAVEAVFASTEPTPTPEARKGKAKVARRIATVRGGRALLALRCAGGPCQGRLKLVATVKMDKGRRDVVVGRLSFGLAAGAKKTFKVRLTGGAARRELAKRGKLRAWVQGSGVVKSTLKLRNTKTRRKR
jgi:hypothetical protein